MAGKTRKKVAAKSSAGGSNKELIAILLFAAALFFLAVVLIKGQNFWTSMHNFVCGIFGITFFLYPFLLGFFAVAVVADSRYGLMNKAVEASVFMGLLNSFISAVIYKPVEDTGYFDKLGAAYNNGVSFKGGGLLGAILGEPLCDLFGKTGAIITFIILMFIFVMIVTGTKLISLLRSLSRPVKAVSWRERKEPEPQPDNVPAEGSGDKKKGKLRILKGFDVDVPVDDDKAPAKDKPKEPDGLTDRAREIVDSYNTPEEYGEPAGSSLPQIPVEDPGAPKKIEVDLEKETAVVAEEIEEGPAFPVYKYPPFDLLDGKKTVDHRSVSRELDQTAERLVEVLRSFGVETRVLDISRGPTVTRYELQPCAGVKISKITGLADDIALNLAAAGVRIEAPIPNKAAVGIEVPNKTNEVVGVREIIESSSFSASKSKLTVALGRDISGNAVIADIAKMPHGLIAGATGSGKSVCINSIVVSLLYKANPDEVKMLMIDPKIVELGVYNGIPHLLVPVVTDPKKAAGALSWAVMEMEKRYTMFADRGVRDIESYNRFVDTLTDEPEVKRLPHIVIIIDELADLMMTAPNEVEDMINRIAAKARAAGMHLLIATQRPSVDVVTGVIKANIPTRIAFTVSSHNDSRTILDAAGAEKLLGKGDMLYNPVGAAKPKRLQGCFVSEEEVAKVVDFVKNSSKPDYDDDIIFEIDRQASIEKNKKSGMSEEALPDDPLLTDAILVVIETGQASASYLQRRFRLGYSRAGRLIDDMEKRGIIGPYEGSKPRKVLITKEQFYEQQATAPDETEEV